jgi:hypothetical protein
VIRRVTVIMLTARAGGQSKPFPRFRRQTRAQFKQSHRQISLVGPGAVWEIHPLMKLTVQP